MLVDWSSSRVAPGPLPHNRSEETLSISLSILLCRFINVVLAVFCLFPPYRPTYLENIKLSLAIGGRMRIDCYANGQSVRARVCCPVTHLPIVSFAKTETSSSSTRSKWKEARERERERRYAKRRRSLSLSAYQLIHTHNLSLSCGELSFSSSGRLRNDGMLIAAHFRSENWRPSIHLFMGGPKK